jgi:hypothetical protein
MSRAKRYFLVIPLSFAQLPNRVYCLRKRETYLLKMIVTRARILKTTSSGARNVPTNRNAPPTDFRRIASRFRSLADESRRGSLAGANRRSQLAGGKFAHFEILIHSVWLQLEVMAAVNARSTLI